MVPVIRGPGKVPPARTAGRVKPSGATSTFTMCRSATGPMAAYALMARPSVMNEVKVALKVIVKYTGVICLRLCVYET